MTTAKRGDVFVPDCPTRHLLDRIGTKWVSMAMKVLHDAADGDRDGEVRFAEMRRRMPGISQKMLSQTLGNLVADGLVRRRVDGVVPPAVYYSLTPLGRSLAHPLEILREWAEVHMPAVVEHRTHSDTEPGHRPIRSGSVISNYPE